MPVHFGLTVLPGKKGLKLIRENYAWINNRSSLFSERTYQLELKQGITRADREITINGEQIRVYSDERGQFYSDEWCIHHQNQCLENFDLHMSLFKSLDRKKFDKELSEFTKSFPMFTEVSDLNDYDEKSGYYIMILEEYCQVYCGTTSDIKKRIRQHWSGSKEFDRLLFPQGAVNTSIMSIDSFRAYDTTRILAFETSKTFDLEDKYILHFSPEFCTNRMSGGRIEGGLIGVLNMIKSRNLE